MSKYSKRLKRLAGYMQTVRAQQLLDELLGGSMIFTSPKGEPGRYIAHNGRIYSRAELEDVKASLAAAGIKDLCFVFLGYSAYHPWLPIEPDADDVY